MKKFLKTIIITFLVILILLCLEANLDIVGLFAFNGITSEELLTYDGYYYEQLSELQKKIYVKIDKKSSECNRKVTLGMRDLSNIEDDVNKALTAFIYDNPECFNVENKYSLTHISLATVTFSTLKLEYIYDDVDIMKAKANELESAAQSILAEVIKPGMTDYEKELAIHDELIRRASYYTYSSISDIPALKHTAYSAVVEGQTVCDGYTKAFKMLLNKENIECILVSGTIDDEAHAWNMVKLDGQYYNVDVTSDELDDENIRHVMHRYFNLSNGRIELTHKFDELFKYPESESDEYDYYIYNDFVLEATDNVSSKLEDIVSKQEQLGVLELMVDDRHHIQTLVNTLYYLNFNNMKINGNRKVEYLKLDDVYIFEK